MKLAKGNYIHFYYDVSSMCLEIGTIEIPPKQEMKSTQYFISFMENYHLSMGHEFLDDAKKEIISKVEMGCHLCSFSLLEGVGKIIEKTEKNALRGDSDVLDFLLMTEE